MGQGLAADALVSYTFYRSRIVFWLFLPGIPLWLILSGRKWKKQQKQKLEQEFRTAIDSLAGELRAGYSTENAIRHSREELAVLYGEEAMIVRTFSCFCRELTLKRMPESLFLEFARSSGIPEVENFAAVFQIARRNGGPLVEIIARTSTVIGERFRIREEIRSMTAQVRLEQNMMRTIPFLIILYIDLASPGFFDPMYETAAGRLVMTVCLAGYVFALWLGEAILQKGMPGDEE